MNIISLGAGVQSSTMALMAAHGEITPMPDCAIFADTGAEPRKVMDWLDWLETELPFPVYRVMHRTGLTDHIKDGVRGLRIANPPFFADVDGKGVRGPLRRQCTSEFKINPIRRKVRELLGLAKGERAGGKMAIQWIGISTDEAQRMKPSHEAYVKHIWPLIDKGVSRLQCLEWMSAKGYQTPTKSSCTYCPYHDDKTWREMKNNDPVSFAEAVEIDELIRDGVKGVKNKLYLHGSLKPLTTVDFRNAKDMGQIDAFDNECEGMCGV
jgi:hypothetical protein